MSSTFLNQIGLGEFDLGYLLIGMGAVILLLIIFLILLIVQIRKTSKLKKRLDKFLSGKDGASLEKDIAGLYEDNKFLKANTEKNKKDIRTLYKNMESAYQKMGLVKYDAFTKDNVHILNCLTCCALNHIVNSCASHKLICSFIVMNCHKSLRLSQQTFFIFGQGT